MNSVNSVGISGNSNPQTIIPSTIPNEPIITNAVPFDTAIEIEFTPQYDGGTAIIGYRVAVVNE
jgi:hypothetical protein